MNEFLQRLSSLSLKKQESSDSCQDEEQKRIESDLNINSIIEESKAVRKTIPDQQVRTSVNEEEQEQDQERNTENEEESEREILDSNSVDKDEIDIDFK